MLSFIGNQFRRPSGIGGKLISFLMKKGNIYAYDKIIEILDIKQTDRILEIGYGHGVGINKIVSRFNCFLTGVDFSKLMFDEATKRNKTHIDNKKVELFYGDFLSSEIQIQNYDKVFCINVVYFWDNPEVPFAKIKDGLKDGGVFCFYMAHSDELRKLKFTTDDIFNKYSIEQITNYLKVIGFREISFKYDKGYLVNCKK